MPDIVNNHKPPYKKTKNIQTNLTIFINFKNF